MRLADFIEHRLPLILAEWENFARTLLPASAQMTSLALRDHAEEMLQVIAKDLRTGQTRAAQRSKSFGEADAAQADDTPLTAAQLHGSLRASAGIGGHLHPAVGFRVPGPASERAAAVCR